MSAFRLYYQKDGKRREFPVKRFNNYPKAVELARELAKHNKAAVYIYEKTASGKGKSTLELVHICKP